MQVAGMAEGLAPCGVAAGDRPPPFGEQHVDLRKTRIPAIVAAQIVARLVQIAVGLEEHDVVAEADDAVNERAAMATAPVGGVGDPRAQESPEAVPDPHLATSAALAAAG